MGNNLTRPWQREERSSRLIELGLNPCAVKVEELGNALPSHISAAKIRNLEITCVESNRLRFAGKLLEGRSSNRITVLAEVIESMPALGKQRIYSYPLGYDVLSPEGDFYFTTSSVGDTIKQLSNGHRANFHVRLAIFGMDIWDQYQYVGDRMIKLNGRLVDIRTARSFIPPLEPHRAGDVKPPQQPETKPGSFIPFL